MPASLAAAILLAGLSLVPAAAAAEVCRYTGTISRSGTPAGQIAARSETTADGGLVTIEVTLALRVKTWLYEIEYLAQEITTWRADELQRVAVNTRMIVDGHIRRQQWDLFVRGPAGLEARRVQARRLPDFERRHPGFVSHWDPAAFGQPWLQDYTAAPPERRPDLDLPREGASPSLRTPLALAFYWSRWLPPGGRVVPVFLPGFKHHARVDLGFGPATPGDGWLLWQVLVRHPDLGGAIPSTAKAWVSPDGYLQRLAFDVHASQGSAQAVFQTQGCQGVAITPVRRQTQ
ncbi:MAG: hypothetical protein ACJ8H8_25760 [Geminicoccaceae bacterium]